RDDITDIPCEDGWRQLSDVPDAIKLKRAIHVTAVTPSSQQKALSEFDTVVQKIEECRAAEIADQSLFAAWKGNPEDKATCDACDAGTSGPDLRKRQDSRAPLAPTLPTA